MSAKQGGAPAWLFSFVDLAFLMLIAMTQLAGDVGRDLPDLGEMVVPRIGSEHAPGEVGTGASRSWQLRVLPALLEPGVDRPAFALMASDEIAAGAEPARLDRSGLADSLARLSGQGVTRPLLAPHESSRSQDLLDAAALLEEHWPSRRRALVARFAGD